MINSSEVGFGRIFFISKILRMSNNFSTFAAKLKNIRL